MLLKVRVDELQVSDAVQYLGKKNLTLPSRASPLLHSEQRG